MFSRISKKFPCAKPLIDALKRCYKRASPKDRKIIEEFVHYLYKALKYVPDKYQLLYEIVDRLNRGEYLSDLLEWLKSELKTCDEVDEIVDKLIDCCDRKMIRRVIDALLNSIPEEKREKIIHKIMEMVKSG